MRALDENRAVAIVKDAVDTLRRLDDASTRRVGTVGFGLGGRVSLDAALQGAVVQATVKDWLTDKLRPVSAPAPTPAGP